MLLVDLNSFRSATATRGTICGLSIFFLIFTTISRFLNGHKTYDMIATRFSVM